MEADPAEEAQVAVVVAEAGVVRVAAAHAVAVLEGEVAVKWTSN